jgi:hypothetical protein
MMGRDYGPMDHQWEHGHGEILSDHFVWNPHCPNAGRLSFWGNQMDETRMAIPFIGMAFPFQ